MTNSIPSSSSSSSSVQPPVADAQSKKRPLPINESAASGDAEPSLKRAKTIPDEVFSKSLTEASEHWAEHNKALVATSLKPLLKTPMTAEQQKLVLELLKTTIPSTEAVEKDEGELAVYNANLYKQFEDLDNKRALQFLTKAIENKQLSLIIRLLKKVDLSEDNDESRKCVEAASKSIPTIACMVLEKKPACWQNFLQSFLMKAFEYSSAKLFSAVLQLNPPNIEFLNHDAAEKCADALLAKNELSTLIFNVEPLLANSQVLWALIEIGDFLLNPSIQASIPEELAPVRDVIKEKIQRIASKHPYIAESALEHALEKKIRLPLTDKMKWQIQYLYSLITSANKEYSPRNNVWRLIANLQHPFDVKLVVESLLWLIQLGFQFPDIYQAHAFERLIINDKIESVKKNHFDQLLIELLKGLPKSFKAFNETFNCCFKASFDKNLYEQILKIAQTHSPDLIDIQDSLDTIVQGSRFDDSIAAKLDFLQRLGGKVFGADDENLLACHETDFFPYFKKQPGYAKALKKTDKNGLGVLTHSALRLATEDSNTECLDQINMIARDVVFEPSLQDIFCCYLVLQKFQLALPLHFKPFMRKLETVPYTFLEKCVSDLLKGCLEASDSWNLLKEEPILKVYEDHLESQENKLFTVDFRHFQKALHASRLTDIQQKEIASINFSEAIEKMLIATNFNKKRVGDEAAVKTFLQYIKERAQVSGVPPGIPNEISNPLLRKGFENFEKSCRAAIPMDCYSKILCDFPALMKFNVFAVNGFGELDPFLKQLKDAFEKEFPSILDRMQAINSLQIFVDAQTKKENFYSELEDKLRIIIYSYSLGKAPASTASSSSSASSGIDLDSAFTLLCTIVEAMTKCATKWVSDLQLFEEFALEAIQKAGKKNEAAQVQKLTDLECQLHTVLAQERSRLIRSWATHWTQKQIELRKRNGEDIAVQNAEYGLEIHYGYAALQHRGQYLGIPRAEKNVEHLVKWTNEMDNDLMEFIRSHYSPGKIFDFVSGAINQIDKSCVIDWMQDNLLGSWKEDVYAKYETNVMASLQKALEPYQKEAGPREQLFSTIWELLSPVSVINFQLFRPSIYNAVVSGKSIEHIQSGLAKIVKDACLKSRKVEFNSVIHDANGLIRRGFIRKFLFMHHIISEAFTKEVHDDKPNSK